MVGELLKAIVARWVAKDMDSIFTGRPPATGAARALFYGTLLPPTSVSDAKLLFPCVAYLLVGSSRTDRASSTTSNKVQEYRTAILDFTVHSRGGLSAASALVEQLKDVYDNMHATLGSGVTLKRFFIEGESVVDDSDYPNVKDWTVTYEAVLEQARTAVNV